jgi:hypothetical protein
MCNTHRVLQTSRNFLHFYAVHTWKDPVLTLGRASDNELRKADVYLRHSVSIESDASVQCVTGDGRTLLLGLDDGSLLSYSWLGKVRSSLPLSSLLPSLPACPSHRSVPQSHLRWTPAMTTAPQRAAATLSTALSVRRVSASVTPFPYVVTTAEG